MEASAAPSPQVAYQFSELRGEHQIGLQIGDHFVPFVALTAQQVDDLLGAAQSPEAQAVNPTPPPAEPAAPPAQSPEDEAGNPPTEDEAA